MPSKHGVRCQSPHGVGIESPHGVHGCGTTPFYVLIPSADNSDAFLFRIDGPEVVWQTNLTSQLGSSLAHTFTRVEFNSHGLFCAMRDSGGQVVVKVDQATGLIIAQTRDLPPFLSFDSNESVPPLCANQQFLYSIMWDEFLTPVFNYRKYDADLNTIPLDPPPAIDPVILNSTNFNFKKSINNRANVITTGGQPRLGPYRFDPDTLDLAGAFAVPNPGASSAFMGDSVLVAQSTEVMSVFLSHTDGGINYLGEYHSSTLGANLSQFQLPQAVPALQGVCLREPAAGIQAELLVRVGSRIDALDPFTQVSFVQFLNPGGGGPFITLSPAHVTLWTLDVKPLLPVDPLATVGLHVIRTHQASVRVVGSWQHNGQVVFFAAEIATPTATPTLTWYTPLDIVTNFNARTQAATAVLGSGEDAPYTPAL